ncbi:MBL fold metallo-hydrolase [Terricaulis sp.]|uniref:MBL fold metallo-hydrolase n=1 Tax=Terricaulis sp. TaxID=2768686 RepID=UPI0037838FFF
MLQAAILAVFLMQAGEAPPPSSSAPSAEQVAPGVYLIRGAMAPQRGPDGNSVVFVGRAGLAVVDTGRHSWHSDAILSFARDRGRPIQAILNTHWHLDHSSGNGRLRAVYPRARVYTTTAVDRALGADGFLTRNLADAPAMLSGDQLSNIQKDEVRIFIATMEERDMLRPQVPVTRSHRMRFAGVPLDVHVTDGAVTDADLWLYDRRSGVAVLGDLVTLPAPFFETACPAQWSAALDEVWATPFTLAIPGHGEPMSRAQFDTYRAAFNAFIGCVNSDAEAAHCAAGWAGGIASLEPLNADLHRAAAPYAEYYVGFLREGGGKSRDCLH